MEGAVPFGQSSRPARRHDLDVSSRRCSGLWNDPSAIGESNRCKAQKYIQDPNVSVVLTQINSKKVFLLGEVQKRGPVDMTPGMTVLQAIASARRPHPTLPIPKKILHPRAEAGTHQKIPVLTRKH